ncbi:MAG: sigma-70 family RNA polymerase sigma factor [Acidobacteriaceae bacterium]|nr:sigma-70 family RNA polymerase sigma factor [Acidobacteriaceae bacterium]
MHNDLQAPDARQATTSEKDAAILLRVQRGEESAIALLFDRYSRIVYSVALRVLREPAAAEDVVQEIFMQIWRSPDSFLSARGSFAGWLVIVTRNRAVDTLRRKRPTEQVEDVVLPVAHDLSDPAERETLSRRARALIGQLPLEQRKALEMAFFDGLTHSEISEITGASVSDVERMLRTALLELRKGGRPV